MNTSTFAKMCGVEKRTLFHYDDIGLLKPAFVRENGYREYTMEQLGTMDMIKIFQACGYSLSEIRQISGMSAPEKQQYAADAVNRIDEKISRLQQMKGYLRAKQQLLEEYRVLSTERFRTQSLSIRYDRKPVEPEAHFFSFLRDGTDSLLLIEEGDEIWLCSPGETGVFQSKGKTVSFFLEIPTESPSLCALIRQTLGQFGFPCKPPFFVECLPHFLLEKENTAVIKVTAYFAAREGDFEISSPGLLTTGNIK